MQGIQGPEGSAVLRFINPLVDIADMQEIIQRVGRVPEFWHDYALANAAAWVVRVFYSPLSVTFKIGETGVFTVFDVTPKWRGKTLLHAWDVAAMRQHEAVRTAAAAVCKAHDLVCLDGFALANNTLSRRFMEQAGMTQRSEIPEALPHGGVLRDYVWYEITREDLGLEPLRSTVE